MVTLSPITIILVAVAVTLVVALAEVIHGRRVRRVARLAFGADGRPSSWVNAVPWLRSIAAGVTAWGLLYLAAYDPVTVDVDPRGKASMNLLVCLDVSPSMQVKDAGPDLEKLSRAAWAGRVVQGILDRLDMATTRISLVAFYTTALPVVEGTFDKEVVRNALDGLPMYVAFDPGPTNLRDGLVRSMDLARAWPPRSATLVVVSDGDASAAQPPTVPASIADVIVIGVGDATRSTVVAGHSSRQDVASLKQLAARLGGIYHDANRRHLPSAVLDQLTMITPRVGARFSARDLALAATGFGGFTLALLGPALMLFGRRGPFARARRAVGRTDREALPMRGRGDRGSMPVATAGAVPDGSGWHGATQSLRMGAGVGNGIASGAGNGVGNGAGGGTNPGRLNGGTHSGGDTSRVDMHH